MLGKGMNEMLNKLPQWKDKECIKCGRKYPQTLFNIEGVLHHASQFMCINTKECSKYVKKSK